MERIGENRERGGIRAVTGAKKRTREDKKRTKKRTGEDKERTERTGRIRIKQREDKDRH
jgi:hypothetical protein